MMIEMICSVLYCAVDALQNWSRKWLLNLNVKKCQVVSYGRHVDKGYTYNIKTKTGFSFSSL